ncbi:hypothetical protein Lalb_Chr25g0280861 [Lupinus albus]|uniref:Uncharacterized protein n=1 Tax=Lupinus albus TaxID=3870 RepID=A0A6A4NDI0_LUPAL|nr:hypothetical protein Lalb_Chr25g0280861 [Lupinus albus]
MLIEKARNEIHKKLGEWRSCSLSKKSQKENNTIAKDKAKNKGKEDLPRKEVAHSN